MGWATSRRPPTLSRGISLTKLSVIPGMRNIPLPYSLQYSNVPAHCVLYELAKHSLVDVRVQVKRDEMMRSYTSAIGAGHDTFWMIHMATSDKDKDSAFAALLLNKSKSNRTVLAEAVQVAQEAVQYGQPRIDYVEIREWIVDPATAWLSNGAWKAKGYLFDCKHPAAASCRVRCSSTSRKAPKWAYKDGEPSIKAGAEWDQTAIDRGDGSGLGDAADFQRAKQKHCDNVHRCKKHVHRCKKHVFIRSKMF